LKISLAAKNKWPVQSAALVSETGTLQLHMKELIRSSGWRMDDPPARPDIALNYLENGTSYFYIVEDSVSMPAYESIRTVINHPAGRLTPILILLLEGSMQDAIIYERVLQVGVTKKPLTPSQFMPTFHKFVSLWETPGFTALRKCAYLMLNGNTGHAIEILKKLTEAPQTASYAIQALMRLFVRQQEWKLAEKMILDTIKNYPRQPSLVLAVANFYSEAHMPAQALRFYMKLKSICNSSPVFSFDIAQAALSLGQIDLAIEALTEWNRARPGNEVISQYLARLYMSEGRDNLLEKVLNMNKANVKRIQEAWEKIENPTHPQSNAS